jgi:hypothetical protein
MVGLCVGIASMELWIGVVEVLTEPSSGGDTRAFTNVVTWATSVSTYLARVLGSENVRPVDSGAEFDQEIVEIIERARTNPDACIFATFHYYPSKPS